MRNGKKPTRKQKVRLGQVSLIGNLLLELRPMCERCRSLAEDELVFSTEDGLVITGRGITAVEGRSVFSGEPVKVRFTDYGFELYGDPEEVRRVREKRCVHGSVCTPKEGRGLP